MVVWVGKIRRVHRGSHGWENLEQGGDRGPDGEVTEDPTGEVTEDPTGSVGVGELLG